MSAPERKIKVPDFWPVGSVEDCLQEAEADYWRGYDDDPHCLDCKRDPSACGCDGGPRPAPTPSLADYIRGAFRERDRRIAAWQRLGGP